MDDLVLRIQNETELLPWADFIKNRELTFDPKLKPALIAMRIKHFFNDD
jgi:chloramphenicol O-acetyltransferase type B